MGLLDKIKNLFTDEEEIIEETEEIEEVKEEEHPLPTFMREKIEREERSINKPVVEKVEEPVSEINLTRETNKFKFPIVFDDQDFEVPEPFVPKVVEKPKEEVKKPTTLYNSSPKSSSKKKEVKKFTPTPIISPVYGILDKNYKKEEVKAKPENTYQITRASKKVDFETVRMKAYGSLSDEINDNLLHDDLVDDTNVEVIDPSNLLYEITTDKDTTIGNAEENYYDFGVSYEIPKEEVKPNVEEESSFKIINHNDEEVKAEKIEVKEEQVIPMQTTVVEDASKENDLELTEDLFSLIDAMYDERNDN